jgi:hypothetical protein
MRIEQLTRIAVIAFGLTAAGSAQALITGEKCTKEWNYWRIETTLGHSPGPKPGPNVLKNECFEWVNKSTASDADKGEYRYIKCSSGNNTPYCYRSDSKAMADTTLCKTTTLSDVEGICPTIAAANPNPLCKGTKIERSGCRGHPVKCGSKDVAYTGSLNPAMGKQCIVTPVKDPANAANCMQTDGDWCRFK